MEQERVNVNLEQANYEIECDRCKKNIKGKLNLKARKVISDIKQHYFDCPYCGKRYVCYYTNSHMRSLMKQKVTDEIKKRLLFEANAIENILGVKVVKGEVVKK